MERSDKYGEYFAPQVRVMSVQARRVLCQSGENGSISDMHREDSKNGADLFD